MRSNRINTAAAAQVLRPPFAVVVVLSWPSICIFYSSSSNAL
jgi:hypothetical protein